MSTESESNSEAVKWCWSLDGYHYGATYPSRVEALADALAEVDIQGVVYVAKARVYAPPGIRGEDVIERQVDCACDNCGEAAETWLAHVTKEERWDLGDKLTAVFLQWLKDTDNMPNFYWVEDVEDVEDVEIPSDEADE